MVIFLIYSHILHSEGGKTLFHSLSFSFYLFGGADFPLAAQTERGLPSFWSTRGFTISLCSVLVVLVGRVVLQVRYQNKEIKKKLVTVSCIKDDSRADGSHVDFTRLGFNSVKREMYN